MVVVVVVVVVAAAASCSSSSSSSSSGGGGGSSSSSGSNKQEKLWGELYRLFSFEYLSLHNEVPKNYQLLLTYLRDSFIKDDLFVTI